MKGCGTSLYSSAEGWEAAFRSCKTNGKHLVAEECQRVADLIGLLSRLAELDAVGRLAGLADTINEAARQVGKPDTATTEGDNRENVWQLVYAGQARIAALESALRACVEALGASLYDLGAEGCAVPEERCDALASARKVLP